MLDLYLDEKDKIEFEDKYYNKINLESGEEANIRNCVLNQYTISYLMKDNPIICLYEKGFDGLTKLVIISRFESLKSADLFVDAYRGKYHNIDVNLYLFDVNSEMDQLMKKECPNTFIKDENGE